MSEYKLHYFPIRGRAEVARFLFAQADVKYDNVGHKDDDWKAFKTKTPFGQMPVLEVDGRMICQSHTIERFLAARFGLAGKTDVEVAMVDMFTQCLEDTGSNLVKMFGEKDETKKAELKKKFEEETLPDHLSRYEKLLEENGSEGHHAVGNDVTLADFVLYNGFEFYKAVGVKVNLDGYPRLKANKEMVEKLPRIANWLKTRPESNF